MCQRAFSLLPLSNMTRASLQSQGCYWWWQAKRLWAPSPPFSWTRSAQAWTARPPSSSPRPCATLRICPRPPSWSPCCSPSQRRTYALPALHALFFWFPFLCTVICNRMSVAKRAVCLQKCVSSRPSMHWSALSISSHGHMHLHASGTGQHVSADCA